MNKLIAWCAIIGVLAVSARNCCAQEDLIAKLRACYEELENAKPITIESEVTTKGTGSSLVPAEDRATKTKRGALGYIFVTRDNLTNEETARGLNSTYGFEIRRPNSSSSWYVTEIKPRKDAMDYESPLKSSPFGPSFFLVSWTKVVNAQSFEITNHESGERDGVKTLTIGFEAGPEPDGGPITATYSNGKAVLLADHYFNPIRFEFDVKYPGGPPGHIEIDLDYDLTTAKYPLWRRIVTTRHYEGETDRVTSEIKREHIGVAPPDGNFYLTAFGLPEPPGLSKSGVAWYVWISIAAIGGIAIILWRRRTTMGRA